MSPIHVGALLNSALYLTGCFLAGLHLNNAVAWRCALVGCGVAFLSYVFQSIRQLPEDLMRPVDFWDLRPIAWPLGLIFVAISWVFGIAAGVALLF